MTQQKPYAWLRHFKIKMDGSTTFGTSPRNDEEFKRELAEFSKKQSQILCDKKSICGTIDAHYALLAPPPPTRKDDLTRKDVLPLSMAEERALKPKEAFKECKTCPEMVVISEGSFMMGSPEMEKERSPDEGPQRTVSIKRFAVGKYAVTFDEWDACVADDACNRYSPLDEGWGRGWRPVINVSWSDAQTYISWLSGKTGKTYRLLAEAEREYVTRAGTTTPFWWGSEASTDRANYDGNYMYGNKVKGGYEQQTLPAYYFAPNPWGLYQVHGNIWEWVEDCWSADNCNQHVRRGGCWKNNPQFLRSAARGPSNTQGRDRLLGFRVARTLEF